MIETLIYVNHLNETVETGVSGVYANYNDLRNYNWELSLQGNKITGFTKGVSTKTLPLVIKCRNQSEGIATRNRIFEVFEKDILAGKHGKLYVGNYYLQCFVTQSEKSEYLHSKKYMLINLTLTTDYPNWIKETVNIFSIESGGGNVEGLNYPHDYPFDYKPMYSSESINNTAIAGSNFRLVFYGASVNPAVYIAGHLYQVNTTVAAGEYLVVDSISKTVVLHKIDGQTENCFALRNKESYVFERIPAGVCPVSWNGEFGFDLILLEERSEPKWI